MDLTRLDPEEKALAARIRDFGRAAGRGSRKFSSFLGERQQLIAQAVIEQHGITGCLLQGGYPDAVRRMLGVFPDWEEPEQSAFPIVPVAIYLPKDTQVSHRDVLGSLMSLRIARESIGDILPSEGICTVFTLETTAPVILTELTKIGGAGVRCEPADGNVFVRRQEYENLRGTISSPRIDALVKVLTGLSREKGAALVAAQRVQKNHQIVVSLSTPFAAGDVITIRGYGKFLVDQIGPPTKKSRLPVLCRKYI